MPIRIISLDKFAGIFPKPKKDFFIVAIPLKLEDGYLNSKEELEVIGHLCQLQNPKKIFEIGTFKGLTTLILSMNSRDSAKIFTLDLPRQSVLKTKYQIDYMNKKYIKKRGIVLFEKTSYHEKIRRLYGDSATFNFQKFSGKIDFVFVDGCHTYEYAKNDTNKAFNILSKKGLIVWHDYGSEYWPESNKFFRELGRKKKLFHIKGTQFLVYKNFSR